MTEPHDTPESVRALADFVRRLGRDNAKDAWELGMSETAANTLARLAAPASEDAPDWASAGEAALSGDRTAFNSLVERHLPPAEQESSAEYAKGLADAEAAVRRIEPRRYGEQAMANAIAALPRLAAPASEGEVRRLKSEIARLRWVIEAAYLKGFDGGFLWGADKLPEPGEWRELALERFRSEFPAYRDDETFRAIRAALSTQDPAREQEHAHG